MTTHANVAGEGRRLAPERTDHVRRAPAVQPSAPVRGRDLHAAREDVGVGLGWLAARIGRSKGHLSKVEREIEDREVTPALVRDYERALGRVIGSRAVARGSAQPPQANTQGGPHAVATGVMAAVTGPVAGVKAPTLLRKILVERHWQTPRTFRVQFLRAAKDLAERESDPALRMLDVSVRQFQRWLDGARPRPDTCRVLEYMFSVPVDQLLSTGGTASVAPSPAAEKPEGDFPEWATLAVPGVPSAPAVRVTVCPGAAVTVVCQDGEPARVAVVAGPVRVLIEAPADATDRLALPAAVEEPSSSGGARIYSISDGRAR